LRFPTATVRTQGLPSVAGANQRFATLRSQRDVGNEDKYPPLNPNRRDGGMIVQRLRDIQNRFGYLPDEELKKLAREADVPLYRVEEVASFFPAFRQERNKPLGLEV